MGDIYESKTGKSPVRNSLYFGHLHWNDTRR